MPGSTDREEWLTNRDIDLHNLVKGNPKACFKEREKSASYAFYCRSRIFVPIALSNLLLILFFEETQDLMV